MTLETLMGHKEPDYNENSIHAVLARLEEKLDSALKTHDQRHEDHETRLRLIEQDFWKKAGVFGVVSLFASSTFSAVVAWAVTKAKQISQLMNQ